MFDAGPSLRTNLRRSAVCGLGFLNSGSSCESAWKTVVFDGEICIVVGSSIGVVGAREKFAKKYYLSRFRHHTYLSLSVVSLSWQHRRRRTEDDQVPALM